MLDELIKMTPEPPNYQLFPMSYSLSAISFLCVHKVGLLVNFKNQKAEIKRMVLNLPEGHDSFFSARSAEKNVRVSLRLSVYPVKCEAYLSGAAKQ
jgi:hypothetical protein